MNEPDQSGRRRALVSATAGLTALATIAGLGLLAATSTPSQASPATPETAPGGAGSSVITLASQEPGSPTEATPSPAASPEALQQGPATLDGIDNVVFVLADDLDWNLFQQVPRLAALQDQGMTFTNHTVTDSLCCPSRTSILRGQYIHNHRVISNLRKTGGGWPTFRDRGGEADCLSSASIDS